MAATAICLQFRRRRRNTSILLFQNPISLHLFSSSSIPDPPNNSDDQRPPSQSQTSLFSHSSDLKSSPKQQPESFQLPFYRKNVMARNGSPINTGSSTEGGKSPLEPYSELRRRLKSLFSHSSYLKSSLKQPESLTDKYRKMDMARNGSPNNTGSSTEGGKSPAELLRESYEWSREQYFQEEIAETTGQTGARWDALFRKLFLHFCEKEVRKGHRPNTTLDKVGWANVQKEIVTRTGRNYTIKQLENHWDSMKTDWQLYKELTFADWERGSSRNWGDFFFNHASDAWWKERMLENPEFVKIRGKERELDIYEKSYDDLFGDIVATGEKASEEFDPTPQEETGTEGSGDSAFETMGQGDYHHIFVILCEDEVKKGNRTNTTLNKVGWANVQKKFAAKTWRKCTIKQMKNHWDSMKTVWQLYKKLGCTYTGLGWNKYVSDEADAWWDERILEYPELKNIRREDLYLYRDRYDVLFGDIVATGEKARVPNQQSGIRRDSICNEEFDPTPQEETGKEGSVDSDKDLATPILSPTSYSGKSKVSSGSKKQEETGKEGSVDSDEDLATPILSPTPYSGKSKVSSRSKRKMSGAELVREGLDGILRALSTATTAANEGGSYAKALDMLDSMDGVEPMSSLYHFGQQFLGKKENRVLWFKSRNDEYRLSALKYNYEEHLRNGGC